MPPAARGSLLLVLPVPLRRGPDGRLCVEKQACNGLDLWAENFPRVVAACPLEPDAVARRAQTSVEYVSADRLRAGDRIELVPLPWAYTPGSFLRHYRSTRAVLREHIRACEYLSFAIGGLIGDWASVAALEADRQGRRFSVWTDRVEHRVIRSAHLGARGLKRVFRKVRDAWVVAPLMKRLERRIIRTCALGLFHGRDCFEAYAPFCRTPHLVHDIHLKPEDGIPGEELAEKLVRVRTGAPLRLAYAGRAVAEKGPLDWVRAMGALRASGVDFSALWLGDGPLLGAARTEAERLGLADRVRFPGFVGDRGELLRALRSADAFAFCHKTPESPRCLIEALMSGTPIVGYDSPYPRDLAGDAADRLLVPRDDVPALARRLAALAADRAELAALIAGAAAAGAGFSDRGVFRHRSELIKRHLSTGEEPAAPHLAGGGSEFAAGARSAETV